MAQTKHIDEGTGGGGGEVNTASNQGTAGVGVFYQKDGVDLQFKNVNAGSDKVTVADDTTNHEIDIDVDESNMKLDDMGTPDDNTDLDASTTRHGLLRKLDNDITHFLRGDGGWAEPPGAGGNSEFEDGGDARGKDRLLGNTDAFDLGFITNNITQFSISEDGIITFTKDLVLHNTIHATELGIIYKDAVPFIHDFSYGFNGTVTPAGYNFFAGGAGNFTMGSTTTNINHASNNVVIGREGLLDNTSGYGNVGLGYNALKANTTGDINVAIGYGCLDRNTTGYHNVAIGNYALHNAISANRCVAIGDAVLSANLAGNNIGIGYNALRYNTTGTNNTAIGHRALRANTTGVNNFGMGSACLRQNTIGGNNTGMGTNSLVNNTTGYFNTCCGSNALGYNSTGNYNSALGYQALYNNTVGTHNTAIGYGAGTNIASGGANSLCSYGVYIGCQSKALLNGQTNEIVIGYNAIGAGSNTVTIGNTSVTKTVLRGYVNVDSLNIKPGSAPGSPIEGDLYMDSTTHKLRCYDGTAWQNCF